MRPNFEDFRPAYQEDIMLMAKYKEMTVKDYLDDLYARHIIDKNTRKYNRICYDDLPEEEQKRWREMASFKGMCLSEYQEHQHKRSDENELMSLPSKDIRAYEKGMTIPEYREYFHDLGRREWEAEKKAKKNSAGKLGFDEFMPN